MTDVLTPDLPDVDDELQLAEKDRLFVRRHRVLSLTLRGMTQEQIATALHVNQATVSRDRTWIRENWRTEYGIPATVAPAEEIGMAVAEYNEVATAAWRDFHSPASNQRTRQSCLRIVLIARQMRMALLQDVGLIDRQIGTVRVGSARADDIRNLLRDEGLLTDAKPSRQLVVRTDDDPTDDDGVDQWLNRNGQ